MSTDVGAAESKQGTATGDTNLRQSCKQPFSRQDYDRARERYTRLYFQIMNREHVAFEDILRARWISPEKAEPTRKSTKEKRRISILLENEARNKFEHDHGPIEQEYWGVEGEAVCALTADNWVHSAMNLTDPELVLYETRVLQLCRDAHRTFDEGTLQGQGITDPRRAHQRWRALPTLDGRSRTAAADDRGILDGPPDAGRPATLEGSRRWKARGRLKARRRWKADRTLKEIGEMLYVVLSRISFAATEMAENKPQDEIDNAFFSLRIEWKTARASVEELIQRQARFEYFAGVGLGALITIPALAVGGWLSMRFGAQQLNEPGEPGSLTAAIIGGAAGAVISVAQRMTTKTRTPLMIDFTAPKLQKVFLGSLRPIVGAVFAAVVYFAIVGGLVSLHANTGQDASVAVAFFAVAGFAAGFSERFATDVLSRASSGILPSYDNKVEIERTEETSLLASEQFSHRRAATVAQEQHISEGAKKTSPET